LVAPWVRAINDYRGEGYPEIYTRYQHAGPKHDTDFHPNETFPESVNDGAIDSNPHLTYPKD
jgi:hypothetical protein